MEKNNIKSLHQVRSPWRPRWRRPGFWTSEPAAGSSGRRPTTSSRSSGPGSGPNLSWRSDASECWRPSWFKTSGRRRARANSCVTEGLEVGRLKEVQECKQIKPPDSQQQGLLLYSMTRLGKKFTILCYFFGPNSRYFTKKSSKLNNNFVKSILKTFFSLKLLLKVKKPLGQSLDYFFRYV